MLGLFSDHKSIYKDASNRSYLYRLDKAREDEAEKLKKSCPDLSKHLDDKWRRGSLNKSASAVGYNNNNNYNNNNSIDFKMNLRNELHSLKYEETD